MNKKKLTLKTFFLTFFFATLLLFIFLPFLCDKYLLPHLLEGLPYNQKELNITTISPWKIRGTLRLMQNDTLIATIPRFEVQYSPTSLLKGKIDTILFDAPSLHLHYTDGTLSLPGQSGKKDPTKKQTTSFSLESPVSIQKIIIRNSHITLQTESGLLDFAINSQFRMGFNSKKENKYKLSTLSIDTQAEGDLTFTSSTQGVFSSEGMLINTEVNIPHITDVRNFFPVADDIAPTGALAIKGQVAVAPNMDLSDYLVNADIYNFRSSFDRLSLTQTSVENPVQIHLEGDQSKLNYKLSGLSISKPEQVDIKAAGTVDFTKKDTTATATIYSTRLNHPFIVDIKGKINLGNTFADLHVTADTFSINKDTSIGPLELNGEFTYNNAFLTTQITGDIARIEVASNKLTLQNINWDIPLQFPLQKQQPQKKGLINIQSLRYKNIETARITADVEQTRDGFNYTTDLISKMELEGQVHCNGSVFLTGTTTASCTLTKTNVDTDLLPDFFAIPDETTFTGAISADAKFEISDQNKNGHLNFNLTNGSLTTGETTINGIETKIIFPHLPSVRSEPGQLITIDSIKSGRIQLQRGKIFFRFENEQQLFLEKARLDWCGGKIEMGSLNLSADMKGIEATVYCDRIGFAELLKQFGIEDTEGQGSLNGRLPVKISEKGIHFDDGFLFSTPGNSGIVRFNNTDQLRQGMPDIGQTATLNYSIKALENFAYNWTKLSFNTEGDDLLLAMQLDGKPAEPLPFGYKNGQIVATEKGPGLQHPVRLDMNFRLPLQDLFQYGNSLQSLMEKM